jgi:hypothetical protein
MANVDSRNHLRRVHLKPLECDECQLLSDRLSDLDAYWRAIPACKPAVNLIDDRGWPTDDERTTLPTGSTDPIQTLPLATEWEKIQTQWVSFYLAIFPNDESVPSPCRSYNFSYAITY